MSLATQSLSGKMTPVHSIILKSRTGLRLRSTAGSNPCAASHWDFAIGVNISSGHCSTLADWILSYSPTYEKPRLLSCKSSEWVDTLCRISGTLGSSQYSQCPHIIQRYGQRPINYFGRDMAFHKIPIASAFSMTDAGNLPWR